MGQFEKQTTPAPRPCWVNGQKAIFHRWADTARPVKARGKEDDDEAPHYQVYSVHAVVEYEDGTVARCWPSEIQFADRSLFDDTWLPWTMEDKT